MCILSLHSARAPLVKQRTMLVNAMLGLTTQFGMVRSEGRQQDKAFAGTREC